MSTPQFISQYQVRVESNGRLCLPTAFRSALEGAVYLCRGLFEKNLWIFPKHEYEELLDKFRRNIRAFDKKGQRFLRKFCLHTEECSVSKSGCIILPERFRTYAGIHGGDTVVLTGELNHIGLWSMQEREAFEQQVDFEEIPDEFAEWYQF